MHFCHQWLQHMSPLIRSWTVSVLVQLYFKHESAGKFRRKFLSPGEDCFKNIWTDDHKSFLPATWYDIGSSCLEGTWSVLRINFFNWFLHFVHNEEFDPHLVLFSNEAWLSSRGEVNFLTASTAYRTSRLVHELRVWSAMNAHRKISTISGQELHMVTASILTVVGQESKIFSSCCTTGEFLLSFLKVIITVNLFLAFFTDC